MDTEIEGEEESLDSGYEFLKAAAESNGDAKEVEDGDRPFNFRLDGFEDEDEAEQPLPESDEKTEGDQEPKDEPKEDDAPQRPAHVDKALQKLQIQVANDRKQMDARLAELKNEILQAIRQPAKADEPDEQFDPDDVVTEKRARKMLDQIKQNLNPEKFTAEVLKKVEGLEAKLSEMQSEAQYREQRAEFKASLIKRHETTPEAAEQFMREWEETIAVMDPKAPGYDAAKTKLHDRLVREILTKEPDAKAKPAPKKTAQGTKVTHQGAVTTMPGRNRDDGVGWDFGPIRS